jgi:hypothetical protein
LPSVTTSKNSANAVPKGASKAGTTAAKDLASPKNAKEDTASPTNAAKEGTAAPKDTAKDTEAENGA